MNILYSFDKNYMVHAMISISSLLENNKREDIKLFLLTDNLSVEDIDDVRRTISKYKAEVDIIDASSVINKIQTKDDFPLAGYARLFVSEIINEDKIIYIDCDTIVNDIQALWDLPIRDKWVAGVQDTPAVYMRELIGLKDNHRYINSGVMVINLKLWREIDIENRMIRFIKQFNGKVPHHDQGVINGVCKDNILIINPRYNFMSQFYIYNSSQLKRISSAKNFYSQKELNDARKAPAIIHYITKFYGRPWEEGCLHPKRDLYLKYKKNSLWKDKELEINKKPFKVKAREYLFYHFPFSVYLGVEKALDFKRRKYYTSSTKRALSNE